MTLIQQDRVILNYVDAAVRRTLDRLHIPLYDMAKWDGKPVYMANAWTDEAGQAWLRDNLPGFQLTGWSSDGVDIVPMGQGKEACIREWAGLHGIAMDQTAAFGDGDNDADMLQAAGIGVALANGSDSAKEAADMVAGDIDQDGIWHALVRMGLIHESLSDL